MCVLCLTCSCSPLLMESSRGFRAVKSNTAFMKLAGNSSKLQTHTQCHTLAVRQHISHVVYLISVPVLRLRRQSVALHKQTESIKIAERQDDHVIVCPVCSYHLLCHRRSSWFLLACVGVRVCDTRLWVSDGWRLPSVIKHRCECGNVIIILRPHSASSHKHTHNVKSYDKSL